MYPNPSTLWYLAIPPIPPGGGVRRDLAQCIPQKGCLCPDKHSPQQESTVWDFSLERWLFISLLPQSSRHILNFSWSCHTIPLKSTICRRLKRLAKEEALWLAHRTTLACKGFLGENYAFTGQLKSIWLFCQLKNARNSVPVTIRCGCLKFPLNEMLGTFIPKYVPCEMKLKIQNRMRGSYNHRPIY